MHEHPGIADEVRSLERPVKHRQPQLSFPDQGLDWADARRPILADRADQHHTRLDQPLPAQRRKTRLLTLQLTPTHHASPGNRSRPVERMSRLGLLPANPAAFTDGRPSPGWFSLCDDDLVGARTDFIRLELPVASGALSELGRFYGDWGRVRDCPPDTVELTVGTHVIAFSASTEQPFHHFALQVPGDRFETAQAWLAERGPLCSEPAQSDPTFSFETIDAVASYVIDPAGNIVELIAFRDLDRLGRIGRFDWHELLGVAEIGLVVLDSVSTAATLAAHGMEVWWGAPGPDQLPFVGERGRSMILAAPGRPWLPIDRPAEMSPATIEVSINEVRSAFSVQDGRLTERRAARAAV